MNRLGGKKVRLWQRRRFYRVAALLCYYRHPMDGQNAPNGTCCGLCVESVMRWW